ncbi:hypothetical protein [Legionella sp. 227]|uniref:hypothetical protein n=1 Tax=Legionella sp. 227 TaxID=3367288 RepID=UPI00370D38E4
MSKQNRAVLLALVISLLFAFTEVQAASVNVDNLSQCMANCKGDKSCVNKCVSSNTPRGIGKDVLQCLLGCGLGVISTADNVTVKEQIKACCDGCLKAMH